MREHFIVDNSMTPDWEVIPLGPVDKEGRMVGRLVPWFLESNGCEDK